MRLIDADATKKSYCEKCKGYFDGHCIHQGECDVDVIETSPTIEAQPVKHGEWIVIDDCEKFIAKCSVCGRIEDSRLIVDYPYCHCGAKMDGGDENGRRNET